MWGRALLNPSCIYASINIGSEVENVQELIITNNDSTFEQFVNIIWTMIYVVRMRNFCYAVQCTHPDLNLFSRMWEQVENRKKKHCSDNAGNTRHVGQRLQGEKIGVIFQINKLSSELRKISSEAGVKLRRWVCVGPRTKGIVWERADARVVKLSGGGPLWERVITRGF